MPGEVKISGKEVAKHNSRESCWIIVHGMMQLPIAGSRLVVTQLLFRQGLRRDGFLGRYVLTIALRS
jgi:hypothetical protein